MNKLIIEQNSNSRTVTSSIIEELCKYAKVLTGANISLKGSLTVSRAYKESVDYLNTNFPEFNINVQTGYFVSFRDDEVKRICIQNWGQDGGCIPSTLANVNLNNSNLFQNNSDILIADLAAFKNISRISFYGSNNITDIYAGHIGTTAINTFQGITWSNETKNSIILGSVMYLQGENKNGNHGWLSLGTLAIKELTVNSDFHSNLLNRCNITNLYLGGTTYKLQNVPANLYNQGTVTNLYVPSEMVQYYTDLKTSIDSAAGKTVITNIIAYDFTDDPNDIFGVLDVTPPSL